MIQLNIEGRASWTQAFCKRWLEKANDYDDRCVNDLFDKFFSLFVAYNKLCSYLVLTLKDPDNPNGDRDKAIKHFSKAVGHERIWHAVSSGSGSTDISRLRILIADGGEFFLFVKKGTLGLESDKERNGCLYNSLASIDTEKKVEAILEYLYLVRCNIFHGDKNLHKKQIKIMQPSTRCLERIVRLGLEKLGESTQGQ
jgi:hypothetical protein